MESTGSNNLLEDYKMFGLVLNNTFQGDRRLVVPEFADFVQCLHHLVTARNIRNHPIFLTPCEKMMFIVEAFTAINHASQWKRRQLESAFNSHALSFGSRKDLPPIDYFDPNTWIQMVKSDPHLVQTFFYYPNAYNTQPFSLLKLQRHFVIHNDWVLKNWQCSGTFSEKEACESMEKPWRLMLSCVHEFMALNDHDITF